MTYRVVLSRQATRYFASVPVPLARRLAEVLKALESETHPPGAKPLKAEWKGLFRIRVGNVRMIYEPREDIGEIRVVKIGPRGDVY